jgi:hypothetical protein
MNLKQIKDPTIAKEKYKWSHQVQNKLDYEKWVDFIEQNNDYFIWDENTPDGIHLRENMDKVPDWAREGILNSNKGKALAEFNTKKGWHEIVIGFHKDFGIVTTTFMKPITKAHLRRLLDMATYLDAYLLNNGNEIIDEQFIESLA